MHLLPLSPPCLKRGAATKLITSAYLRLQIIVVLFRIKFNVKITILPQ